MFVLTVILVALFIWGFGRLLVRWLGWPTDLRGAGRWGIALLFAAVLLPCVPGLVAHLVAAVGPLPAVDFGEALPVLLALGLAALGAHSWRRGEEERERRVKRDDAARFLPRRRAAPAPPELQEGHGHGFVPRADRVEELDRHDDE